MVTAWNRVPTCFPISNGWASRFWGSNFGLNDSCFRLCSLMVFSSTETHSSRSSGELQSTKSRINLRKHATDSLWRHFYATHIPSSQGKTTSRRHDIELVVVVFDFRDANFHSSQWEFMLDCQTEHRTIITRVQ